MFSNIDWRQPYLAPPGSMKPTKQKQSKRIQRTFLSQLRENLVKRL